MDELERKIEALERSDRERQEALESLVAAQSKLNSVFFGAGTPESMKQSVVWQLQNQSDKLDALWKKWYWCKGAFAKYVAGPLLVLLGKAAWDVIAPHLAK